jgi:O-antigen/teichoic acid export membrane protein
MPFIDSITQAIKKLIGESETLRRRMMAGGMWIGLSRLGAAAAEFVRGIVFIRFLQPDDFGLMGVVALVLAGLNVVSETGVNVLIIQRPGEISRYLDTAWTIKFLRGWGMALLVYLTAPLVASFYQDEQLTPILRVISLSFIISGLDNFGAQLLNRELEFKKPALYGLVVNVLNAILGLILVFFLRNVWALVAFHIISSITIVIMAYRLSPYRPRFAFDRDVAKEAFRFGRHIFLSNILIYLVTQGDDAFVGKFLGLTALGYYTRAYFLSNTPATHITQLVSSLTLAGYSRLQDDPVRLRSVYMKTLKLIAITTIPAGLGLLVLAHPIVNILFGERWLPIVPAMQILCIFGMLRAIVGVNGSLLTAIGRPDTISKIGVIQVVVLATFIYPLASRFGLIGVCWAVVLCAVANLAGNIYFLRTCQVNGTKIWGR